MRCKSKTPSEECLTCSTCVTPWHVSCLRSPPANLASTQSWECPDCSGDVDPAPAPASGLNPSNSSLVAAIRAIEADASLNEAQKAKKRQQLVSGKAVEEEEKEEQQSDDFLVSLRKNVSCSICLHLPERPVTVRIKLSLIQLTLLVNVKFYMCLISVCFNTYH